MIAMHRKLFLTTMLGISSAAWIALWLWAQSPYGRYIDHGDWTNIGIAGSICSALPTGRFLLPAVMYVGGWLLMLIAMMLPTMLPLLEIYDRISISNPKRKYLLFMVIGGYLVAWLGFGVFAHLADLLLHQVVRSTEWLTLNGWAVGAAVIAISGIYQFTDLKKRCLDQCRTPMSFLMKHWSGRSETLTSAFTLGWKHGIYCVGCCWATMILMFIVGTANVGWMLLLGAVMAAEKNLPQGKYIAAPFGAGLLVWSFAIVVNNFPMLTVSAGQG